MLVYLYELDSEIKDKKLLEHGQYTLFKEIFVNGNKVVLSINQLVDSLAIYDLINNEETFLIFMNLFRKGSIKINLYGEITSVSKYVQNALNKMDKNKHSFIFSNLPVKREDTEVLEAIKESLQYSDFTLINRIIEKNKDSSNKENNEKLIYLKKFIELVIMLSLEETPKHYPKKSANDENNRNVALSFESIYRIIEEEIHKTRLTQFEFFDQFEKSFSLITSTLNVLNADSFIENRSDWFTIISNSGYTIKEKNCCYEIINLFYNFKVEDSIKDVSYRYERNRKESLYFEFVKCFNQKYLLIENIENEKEIDVDFMSTKKINKLNWSVIERSVVTNKSPNDEKSCVYQNEISETQKRKRVLMYKKTLLNVFYFIFQVLIFVIAQFLLSKINIDIIESVIHNIYLQTFYSIIILGMIGSITSILFKIPDIFQCFINIWLTLYDLLYYLLIRYDMLLKFKKGDKNEKKYRVGKV